MRAWVWLIAGGCIVMTATAGALSDPDRKDVTSDKPSTRPASNAERHDQGAGTRRPPRSERGEGRSYRAQPDGVGGLGGEHRSHSDGRRFGGSSSDRDRSGGPMFGHTPERIERAMKFLQEQYPTLYERLNELREQDPRAFHRQLGHIMPRMPELMNIIDTDPQLGKLIIDEHRLEMDIRDAIVTYRQTKDDAEKDHIRDLISKQFDVRQEKLKLMIANLERELQRKKQYLSEQAGRKDQVVERDLQRRIEPPP
jgi:hypothetical protein